MNETAKILRDEGTFLTTVDYSGFCVSLYLLDDEFYEIHYDPVNNKIQKINLAREDHLEKYLNRIALPMDLTT
jgi:triacylglycerol esterase/lipase EstA (alpha/beta hydrolase family)